MDKYPLEGFAGRLRELWFASEMTQAEVAWRIGVNRKTFAGYIYADAMPNALYIARMCLVFHVSADYLLFGKETGSTRKEGEGDGTEKGSRQPGAVS